MSSLEPAKGDMQLSCADVSTRLHWSSSGQCVALNRDEGVELHDCWVATVRRCERLWQHCQRSEHVTPASSDAF